MSRTSTRTSRRFQSLQLAAVVWLTVVWVALAGGPSLADILGGFLVALVVCLVFHCRRCA